MEMSNLEKSNIDIDIDIFEQARKEIAEFHRNRLNTKLEFEKYELPKLELIDTETNWEKIQMIWYQLGRSGLLLDLIFYILTTIVGARMKDPKTTITAIIMIIAVIAKFFGYDINQDVQNQTGDIIISIMGLITSIGLIFAKDSPKV
jgi:uncharacterized membrane protein